MIKLDELLSDIENKKFSDFSDKVKKSLTDKVNSNPDVQKFKKELERIEALQNAFKSIQSTYGVEEPKEIENVDNTDGDVKSEDPETDPDQVAEDPETDPELEGSQNNGE
jgi:hypothetical protein